MLDKEKEVQGQALYLEFRKAYATIQVLITPEGYAEGEVKTNAVFFRRMLSSHQPKKRWKAYPLRVTSVFQDATDAGIVLEEKIVAEATGQRALNLYDYLDSLVRGGYKLVNDKPIYVELSKEDFTSIRKSETPTKVINRIKATRTALGFPAEVVSVTAV
jgi:hypothetical protein